MEKKEIIKYIVAFFIAIILLVVYSHYLKKEETKPSIIEKSNSIEENTNYNIKIIDDEEEEEEETEDEYESIKEDDEEDESAEEEDEEDSDEETEDEDDDGESYNIGIIFDNYAPFKNIKFTNIAKSYYDGKITKIENDKIYYKDSHLNNKAYNIKAEGALSAAIVCSCGSCESILYINDKNELYEDNAVSKSYVDKSDYKHVTTKLKDNIKSITTTNVDIFPDTCGQDIIIYRDINDELYVHGYEKDYKASEVERTFIKWNDAITKILFKVNKNAKVDKYLTDEKEKPLHAKVVIDAEDEIYVIDNNNIMYQFNNVFKSNIGKKVGKVKSYKKDDEYIVITYSNGKEDEIEGSLIK